MRKFILLSALVALVFGASSASGAIFNLCKADSAAELANCQQTGVNQIVYTTVGTLATNTCSGGTDEMFCICEDGATCVPAVDDLGLGAFGNAITFYGQSESIDNTVDATIELISDADTTLILVGGDAVDANTPFTIQSAGTGLLTLDPEGAAAIYLGSADVTDVTINSNTGITFADGGDSINNTNDDVFDFTRDDAGTVTITASDDNVNAALDILPGGAAGLGLGGASTTATTFLTNDTGDGVIVSATALAAADATPMRSLVIDLDEADDADATDVIEAFAIDLTSESGDAGDTMTGIMIQVEEGAANTVIDSAIAIDNAETTAGTLTDAIIITSAGVNLGVVDAIDVSADNIDHAVNIGNNPVSVGTQVSFENVTSGNIELHMRDYADAADDDMAHISMVGNLAAATSGNEEADFEIQVVSAQADGAGAGGADLVERLKIWSANGQHDITSNTILIAGMYTGSNQIQFTDFDAGNQFGETNDADVNAQIAVDCTTATTGAEDCDFSIGVQEAGTLEDRFVIDADGAITIGTTTVSQVDIVAAEGTVTVNGDITIPDEATGGNAGAVNEFIGVPRISMAALGAMGNGPVLSEPYAPTVAACAPVGSGTEADDAVTYRDTVMDVTSYQYTFAAGPIGTGVGFDCDVTGHAVVGTTSVGFWLRSDTTFASGDLEINLLDAAAVEGDGVLPAYTTANVWQWMEVDVTADCAATCADIDGVELLTTAQAPTTFDGAVINMDGGAFWLAACEETLGADIRTDGVLSILAGVTAGGNTTLLTEWTDYFVHYQTGNDAVCMITDQSANYGMVLYAY